MPHRLSKPIAISINLLLGLFLLTGSVYGKHKKTDDPPFLYLAGTENIERGCGGKLQVLKEGFTFKCATGGFSLPFSAITVMQYRPDVSDASHGDENSVEDNTSARTGEREQVFYDCHK